MVDINTMTDKELLTYYQEVLNECTDYRNIGRKAAGNELRPYYKVNMKPRNMLIENINRQIDQINIYKEHNENK